MTMPVRRETAVIGRRHQKFSLRSTALSFGLVALTIWGVAVTFKSAVRPHSHPVGTVLALLALMFLVAAAVRSKWLRRAARRATLEVAVAGPASLSAPAPADPVLPPTVGAPDAVESAGIDPLAFEDAVSELCRRDGCTDVQVVGGAGDLGADVVATAPDGRRLVIQCKCYAAGHKVGSQDLQRFGGTCYAVHDAELAVVVTTSEYTEPALDYAAQCAILCFDGELLRAWNAGTGPAPWELWHT
ncbi:restriction endonuclease [Streptomyces sp. SID1034]|uniref:restriction endonuclease n=1 Tax=Streptomyces sp. SID1034 TaxID=2690248 RepID=UPI001368E785|nr:restriction endonuclease [Streptomyces sp. SID1034]MYV89661.1 restriction endonuclease [Streptomyces sp. SID1034]